MIATTLCGAGVSVLGADDHVASSAFAASGPKGCMACGGATQVVLRLDGGRTISSLGRVLDAEAEVRLCDDCSHCQTHPSIDLGPYYASEYKTLAASDTEDDLYELSNGVPLYRGQHMANVLAATLDRLGRLKPGLRLLDFGCGKALAMQHLQARLPLTAVHLYDVSRDYVHFWDAFVPASHQACHEMPQDWAGSFDVVTSFFSLEHVAEPAAELQRIRHGLNDHGVLYAVVPNMYSHGIGDMLVVDHVQHYSELSMRRLLLSVGFELLVVDHESHNQGSIYVARKAEPVSNGGRSADVHAWGQRARDIASFWAAFNASLHAFEGRHDQEHKRFHIAGAGFLGSYVFSRLRAPERLAGFIDSNHHKQRKGWQSKPVLAPGTLVAGPDTIVLSGLNAEQEETILPALLPVGIRREAVWGMRGVQPLR